MTMQPVTPEGANHAPAAMMRQDALVFLEQHIRQTHQQRGPFFLVNNEASQMLPQTSLPAWLMTIINQVTSDQRFGYNNDRQALVRDCIFYYMAALVSAAGQDSPGEPSITQAAHIIRHEENLRRELYGEELLMRYTEDFIILARGLSLKMQAGSHRAVYNGLMSIFTHVQGIADQNYWRPTILRMVLNTPEVQAAVQFLMRDESYANTQAVQGWYSLMEDDGEEE